MCGIAGIWADEGGDAEARLAAMLTAMRHRGPDGQGTVAYAGGAAGMVRLALVDLSARGQQPLWSPDGRVAILFNGEMYNWREERARLAADGYPFRTETDTEVVLALFLERGLEFVHQVRGMFAVAFLDWREAGREAPPVLTLVRDRYGMKPLYVARRGREGVAFGSELKAFLAAGLADRRVDPQAVADVLAFGFVVQPATILADVRVVEPGTLEQFRQDRPVLARRWATRPVYEPRRETLAEAAARLRGVLEESIHLHAMADAPVGAFLSGGVDSTAIVALMRPYVPALHTYTLRFPDVPGADEAELAAEAAARLGCVHTEVVVTGADVAAALPRFARDLDQPSVDGLNTWLVGRAAAHDVKGVLSGLGGDELFAGYPVTRRMAQLAGTTEGRLLAMSGQLADSVRRRLPRGVASARLERLAARRSMLALWTQPHTVFPLGQARRLAGLSDNDEAQFIRLQRSADARDRGWREESAVGVAQHLDTVLFMGYQLLRDSDATSMAHSLELRVPFVDLEVSRFSRTCLDEWKLDPRGRGRDRYEATGSKRVLLEALRDVLPADLGKRRKLGFVLPVERWLGRELADVAREACAPETLRGRGLVDPEVLPGELTVHQRWTLLVLEQWARGVLDAVDLARAPLRGAA